ncbi:SPT2 chromatin protein-domain-containing protein [Scheffersomyces xylosifermentans]|uniref:SPT2 chromatin protein-domain-containing protein n=1 Tax=Scheffersomyces xylosifermentans TaxID=1304137 RepID=UPI00315D8BE0
MSLSTILQHVKKKGQPPAKAPQAGKSVEASQSSGNGSSSRSNDRSSPSTSSTYTYRSGEKHEVDPVVAMLKEKRRLEREKREQEERAKKGLAPKKSKSANGANGANGANSTKKAASSSNSKVNGRPSNINSNIGNNSGRGRSSTASPSRDQFQNNQQRKSPVKKLTYNDLMKRATKIDQTKLSIALRPKSKSPESAGAVKPMSRSSSANPELSGSKGRMRTPETGKSNPRGVEPGYRNRSVPLSSERRSAPIGREKQHNRPTEAASHRQHKPQIKAPLPIRGPSTKLEERLKYKDKPLARKGGNRRNVEEYDDYDEDEDDDLDSFIASDEEEEDQRYSRSAGNDYDRDEIWAIFNKGRKRAYYDRYDDYSDDDMEATGADILEEEQSSRRKAELEDRREMEEEKRLAALKKAKKARAGR